MIWFKTGQHWGGVFVVWNGRWRPITPWMLCPHMCWLDFCSWWHRMHEHCGFTSGERAHSAWPLLLISRAQSSHRQLGELLSHQWNASPHQKHVLVCKTPSLSFTPRPTSYITAATLPHTDYIKTPSSTQWYWWVGISTKAATVLSKALRTRLILPYLNTAQILNGASKDAPTEPDKQAVPLWAVDR